jgi:drug/metabolite transporter (DMT)-like permease
MAISSASFFIALNHTSVARVLFIQAVSPALAAILAWIMLAEPVTQRTVISILGAVAGLAVMTATPVGGPGLGDLFAFLAALFFALSVVITRRRRDVSMTPAPFLAQLLLIITLLPLASLQTVHGHDLLILTLLGGGQIGLGLALITAGARLLPAGQVTLIALLEIVLGPVWPWLSDGERPDSTTLIGGAIVIAAILFQAATRVGSDSHARQSTPPPIP